MQNGVVHPHKQQIVAALLAGEKYEWIAATFNCSTGTISSYRKKLNLPKKNNFDHPKKTEIIDALQRGVRWSVIVKTYGCAESTLSRYRKHLPKKN